MGMVVRSNVMAINAFRQLGMNNSQVSKSLEKLSSGFRINRAGDDASGLAISEKMKAQIKGLETASSNSQDGISLIQTAEGALTEVHDMLNRMVELAGKSANGTMDDTVDRAALQNEVKELQDEINRIAKGTNFNGIKLLDGSLGGGTTGGAAGVPSISGLDLSDKAASKGSFALNTLTKIANLDAGAKPTMKINYTDANGKNKVAEISFTVDAANNKLVAADGTTYDLAAGNVAEIAEQEKAFVGELKKALGSDFKVSGDGAGNITFESATAGANTKIDSIIGDIDGNATNKDAMIAFNPTDGVDAYQHADLSKLAEGDIFTIGGKKFAFAADQDAAVALGKDVNVIVSANIDATAVENMANLIEQKTGYKPEIDGATNTQLNFKAPTGTAAGAAGKGLVLQIGDTGADFNQMTVSIDAMDVESLGIGAISVGSQDDAKSMLTALRGNLAENGSEKGAINMVSDVRAKLGALQNRLEHTINNLDVAAENMTAANSRIRDTDMAKQMMEYTKMNVLTQAAQAMLAQANQQPQSVLQLLQ